MAISLNFAAQSALTVRTFAATDFGRYVDVASSVAEPRTLRVDSTIKPGGSSSFLIRSDVRKIISTVPRELSAYVVVRGALDAFTPAQITEEIRFVALQGWEPNINALLRGER